MYGTARGLFPEEDNQRVSAELWQSILAAIMTGTDERMGGEGPEGGWLSCVSWASRSTNEPSDASADIG